MRELIEFSENNLGDYIAKFLVIYQLSTARMDCVVKEVQQEFFTPDPIKNITNQMHHTAEIHYIATNLKYYSMFIRNKVSYDGPKQEHIRSALQIIEFSFPTHNGQFDERYTIIDRPFITIWDDLSPQP
jgi:hypothetical protein